MQKVILLDEISLRPCEKQAKTVGALYMGHITLQRPQNDLFCNEF